MLMLVLLLLMMMTTMIEPKGRERHFYAACCSLSRRPSLWTALALFDVVRIPSLPSLSCRLCARLSLRSISSCSHALYCTSILDARSVVSLDAWLASSQFGGCRSVRSQLTAFLHCIMYTALYCTASPSWCVCSRPRLLRLSLCSH